MHQNLGYLFAAFAVTWIALFVYLFIIQRMIGETAARIRALEHDRTEADRGGS